MEYILYDVDKIKDFVFDSFKPKGVKGASELLKALDFDLSTKKKEYLLQVLTQKFNIPDDKIIFSKGGSGLIKSPDNNGKEICDWLEDEFKVHAKGGSLTAVFHKEEKEFSTTFDILNFKARQKKSDKLLTRDMSVTIFNDDEKDRCGYCGKRKSSDLISFENESIPICEICLLKRKKTGESHKKQLEAETLEDICVVPGLPTSQFILVIYGDLNEAGAHLSGIKNEDELQRFSNGISKTLDNARNEIEKALEQNEFKFLAPVIGGDDIILFTHPVSFELIKEHLFRIEKDIEKTGLKMNFSFHLAKHKFPIYHLFKLSQSLLDLTKDLYYRDSQKQARYGFFKVLEGNYRVSQEDVYSDKDFMFLFDTAKRVHENKDIHTSALYNLLGLLSNNRSLPEKELNMNYFLSRHREFKDYILADDSNFQLIRSEGKIKLTPDVLEDLIDMKDLLYKPGENERRNNAQ